MTDTESPRHIFRNLGAVLAGLVTVTALSIATDGVLNAAGIFPRIGQPTSNSLLIVATVYRTIYSVFGCYVAARLAPSRPMLHAMALGVIGFVLSVAGAAATWNGGAAYAAKWYPLTLVAVALPAAWVGGRLREVQLRNQSSPIPGDPASL